MAEGGTTGDGARAPVESDAGAADSAQLAELRRLLFVQEQAQLASLQHRLDDPRTRARELSDVLPDAVLAGVSRGPALASALTPVVEEAIHTSVRRDPHRLVDAISPVMGPAIRRSISAALRGMVQTLNQTLETSLSWRGVLWRIEAARTGRPFAEVVLLHSLVFQVEQVFLIHKQTGLLLQHVVTTTAEMPDPAVVSGMLTAVQDFVNESFNAAGTGTLDVMHVGDLEVWVEPGPLAVLVAVVRGQAPAELRTVLQSTLDDVHREQGTRLAQFAGDATPFEACRHQLEACLLSQRAQPSSGRLSGQLVAGIGLTVLVVGFWLATSIRGGQRWTRYLDRLRAEPGLVLISTETHGGRYYVSGLRDPLAGDPGRLVTEAGLQPGQVVARWEAYQSMDPRFVVSRARALLSPPKGVELAMEAGVLQLTGVASRQWITDSLRVAMLVPGVLRVHSDGLRDEAVVLAEQRAAALDAQVVRFAPGSAALDPAERTRAAQLVHEARRLQEAARAAGLSAAVDVVGAADATGSESTNQRLALMRAAAVVGVFESAGFSRDMFNPGPAREVSERRVTFRTRLKPAPAKEGTGR